MASGMRYGYRRSLPNIADMQFGVALQLVVVGIGLGALLAASTLAFNLVNGCGVAYLCYLGWQQFRAEARPLQLADADAAAGTPRALFVQGFLVNASNPKATILLLAVLPQFIDPHAPPLPQYLVCMATLTVVDIIVMSASRKMRQGWDFADALHHALAVGCDDFATFDTNLARRARKFIQWSPPNAFP